jgi:hypothetical protein
VVFPDEALIDTSRCLATNTAAFSRPGRFDVACATLCHTCNGRSFPHTLSHSKLNAAFARHAEHHHRHRQLVEPDQPESLGSR